MPAHEHTIQVRQETDLETQRQRMWEGLLVALAAGHGDKADSGNLRALCVHNADALLAVWEERYGFTSRP